MTGNPSLESLATTPFQLDASAKAPCTSTTVGLSDAAWAVDAMARLARARRAVGLGMTGTFLVQEMGRPDQPGIVICEDSRRRAQCPSTVKRISEKPGTVSARFQSRCSSQMSCTQLVGRAPAWIRRVSPASWAWRDVPPTASTTG